MILKTLFSIASYMIFGLSGAAQASSAWTCNVKAEAVGPNKVMIVEEEKNVAGPCGDYKKGEIFEISPVLNPSGQYEFKITVQEHMNAGENKGPQWTVVTPAE